MTLFVDYFDYYHFFLGFNYPLTSLNISTSVIIINKLHTPSVISFIDAKKPLFKSMQLKQFNFSFPLIYLLILLRLTDLLQLIFFFSFGTVCEWPIKAGLAGLQSVKLKRPECSESYVQ